MWALWAFSMCLISAGGALEVIKTNIQQHGVIIKEDQEIISSLELFRIRIDVNFSREQTTLASLNNLLGQLMPQLRDLKTTNAYETYVYEEVNHSIIQMQKVFSMLEQILTSPQQPLLQELAKGDAIIDINPSLQGKIYNDSLQTIFMPQKCGGLDSLPSVDLSRLLVDVGLELSATFATEASAGNRSATGRRGRTFEQVVNFLHGFNQDFESYIKALEAAAFDIGQGNLPFNCLGGADWDEILQDFYRAHTTPDQLKRIRRDTLNFLSRYPSTTHFVKRTEGGNMIESVQLTTYVPDFTKLIKLERFQLKYTHQHAEGHFLVLADQPPTLTVDHSRRWKVENIEASSYCIQSRRQEPQLWCHGSLKLQPATLSQCLLTALPPEGRMPPPSCFHKTSEVESTVIEVHLGQIFVNPVDKEKLRIRCAKKSFDSEINTTSMVFLPRGCILVAKGMVFLPNPASKILNPPLDWPDRKSQNADILQDINTVEILHYESQDVLTTTLMDENSSLDIFSSIWQKIRTIMGTTWFQVTCGLILVGLTIYCCCAPASWPRFNCCLACIPVCIDGIAICLQTTVGAIRRYRQHHRSNQRRRQATVNSTARGIEELTPLEAEIQMARLQSPPRLALTHI